MQSSTIPRPQASKRRNSHGDRVIDHHQSHGGELHGAEPTSDPALLPPIETHPGPVRGGPPAPRPHSKPSSEQQKKRPRAGKVRKNRLRAVTDCSTIQTRRIIRAGRKRRQPLTPLCRRSVLPHSKITCATLIIPIIPLFYKGNLHGLVCCSRAVQGITYNLRSPFVRPAGAHGGRECPTPTGRSAGETQRTSPFII